MYVLRMGLKSLTIACNVKKMPQLLYRNKFNLNEVDGALSHSNLARTPKGANNI